jgi:hypothetical protein
MRLTTVFLCSLLTSVAHPNENIQRKITETDKQLSRAGVAVVCSQTDKDRAYEVQVETLNSIISGLETPVAVSAPAVAIAIGSYKFYFSVCVTVTRKSSP